MSKKVVIPRAFFWRRLHSLMGLWLTLFLVEHLITNSQAALWIGEDGAGFIHGVNLIQSLPYLHLIEILLLAVPIAIHMIWGIHYLMKGKFNAFPSDGSRPSLPEYPRNHQYTWQRITSWVLVLGIVGHVIQMRFIDYPASVQLHSTPYYFIQLNHDKGLDTLAARLSVDLYDKEEIAQKKEQEPILAGENTVAKQEIEQYRAFIQALDRPSIRAGQVVAVAKDFGTATLLAVRETFKRPIMLLLYTLFVLAACFHAFNGLWTFCITWGMSLTERSQQILGQITTLVMLAIGFLGLAAIWGTYWINLRY